MEEILASIRRIISEDGEEGESKAAPNPETEGVLELTEMVAEGGEVVSLRDQMRKQEKGEAREAAKPLAPAKAPVLVEPLLTAPPAAAQAADSGLMSEEREAAAAAAMGGLMEAVQEEPLTAGGRTVEDLARELLRPMLRSWLDDNLPILVERLVKDEIERVVGRARGR